MNVTSPSKKKAPITDNKPGSSPGYTSHTQRPKRRLDHHNKQFPPQANSVDRLEYLDDRGASVYFRSPKSSSSSRTTGCGGINSPVNAMTLCVQYRHLTHNSCGKKYVSSDRTPATVFAIKKGPKRRSSAQTGKGTIFKQFKSTWQIARRSVATNKLINWSRNSPLSCWGHQKNRKSCISE